MDMYFFIFFVYSHCHAKCACVSIWLQSFYFFISIYIYPFSFCFLCAVYLWLKTVEWSNFTNFVITAFTQKVLFQCFIKSFITLFQCFIKSFFNPLKIKSCRYGNHSEKRYPCKVFLLNVLLYASGLKHLLQN